MTTKNDFSSPVGSIIAKFVLLFWLLILIILAIPLLLIFGVYLAIRYIYAKIKKDTEFLPTSKVFVKYYKTAKDQAKKTLDKSKEKKSKKETIKDVEFTKK